MCVFEEERERKMEVVFLEEERGRNEGNAEEGRGDKYLG